MKEPTVAMEVRQRTARPQDDVAREEKPRTSILKRVKAVDMFPKPKEDFKRAQSAQGAIVSIVAVIIIGSLLLWELGAYIVGRDAYSTDLSVSGRTSQDVRINMDITFPRLQCHDISLDVMDAAGGMQMNIAHEMQKSPIDRDGHLVFTSKFDFILNRKAMKGTSTPVDPSQHDAYDPKSDPNSPLYCGDCYINTTTKCCNSCKSVMEEFDKAGIPRPHMSMVDQCALEVGRGHPGCNLRGSILVKQVKGNFHFKPGVGVTSPFGWHIHEYDHAQLRRFNVSHRINHLSMGEDSGRFTRNGVMYPLDGAYHSTGDAYEGVHYFLNVVPTAYITGWGSRQSFEYSAQKHSRALQMAHFDSQATPGLYFLYDFHAMEVQNTFRRPPVGHFIVQLCGIVGGLFVILGFVDRIVERFANKAAC